jgi:hypothetical protein
MKECFDHTGLFLNNLQAHSLSIAGAAGSIDTKGQS